MASTPGQRTDGVRDRRHPDWHDHGLAASSEGGKTRIEEACEGSSAAHDFAYAKIGSSEAIEGATAGAMCNPPAALVPQVNFCNDSTTKGSLLSLSAAMMKKRIGSVSSMHVFISYSHADGDFAEILRTSGRLAPAAAQAAS